MGRGAGVQLDEVVPLGRGLDEYHTMFALQPDDTGCRLLGCGDGPAAFNAEWTAHGGRVISLDPLYSLPAGAIGARIAASFPEVVRRMRADPGAYRLGQGQTIDDLAARRWAAMQRFLSDYPAGGRSGRYVAGGLPQLPFADATFDLAVCAHLLFLYEDHLSRAFHTRAILELLRVAAEVRLFPLVNLAGRPSVHLEPVRTALHRAGAHSAVMAVDYEVQRGARHMLKVWRSRPAGPSGETSPNEQEKET